MRTLKLYMAALVSVLGFASASQAGIIIDFLIGGESSVNAAPSSTVVVDIYMTATGTSRISGYGFAITYDGAEVAGGTATTILDNNIYNNGLFTSAAGWTPGGGGLALDTGTAYAAAMGNSTLTTPAQDVIAAHGAVKIGSITFHVTAALTDGLFDISGCYDCTAFGPTGDGSVGSGAGTTGGVFDPGTTTFNGAQINVIPEPTTASLLGLGLLGLTVSGRRRS